MPQNMTNVTIAVTAMPVEKNPVDNVLCGLSKYEEVAVISDILKSTAAKTKSSSLHMWAKMPFLSFNHTTVGNPEEVPGEVWCKDLSNDLHLGKLMPSSVYAYMLECFLVMTRLVYMSTFTFLGFDTVWYRLNAPIKTWFMTHGTKTRWNVAFRFTGKWRHNDNFQDGRTVYHNNSKWQYTAMRWSTCRPIVTNPLSNTPVTCLSWVRLLFEQPHGGVVSLVYKEGLS